MKKLGEFEEEHILERAKDLYQNGKADIRLDPKKTALLVIDLTDEFTKPEWTQFWIPEATRQLPKVRRLIDACREAGVTVIYTFYAFHPKHLDGNPVSSLMAGRKGYQAQYMTQLFTKESIDPAVKPKYDEDVLVPKYTYGAFTNTPLDFILKNLKADTVIICGTMTNYCCGTTAREAHSRGYKVVFGRDVNSCDDPQIQEAELKTLRRGFALVLTSDEIVEALKGKGPYAVKY